MDPADEVAASVPASAPFVASVDTVLSAASLSLGASVSAFFAEELFPSASSFTVVPESSADFSFASDPVSFSASFAAADSALSSVLVFSSEAVTAVSPDEASSFSLASVFSESTAVALAFTEAGSELAADAFSFTETVSESAPALSRKRETEPSGTATVDAAAEDSFVSFSAPNALSPVFGTVSSDAFVDESDSASSSLSALSPESPADAFSEEVTDSAFDAVPPVSVAGLFATAFSFISSLTVMFRLKRYAGCSVLTGSA